VGQLGAPEPINLFEAIDNDDLDLLQVVFSAIVTDQLEQCFQCNNDAIPHGYASCSLQVMIIAALDRRMQLTGVMSWNKQDLKA
jgi:hypothetical protein